MATIRARCPACGDVEMTTKDVSVRVCADTNTGSYSFVCPACLSGVTREAEQRVVELLVSAGVDMTLWSLPVDLGETRDGPPFTWDDVLEFHDLLETPNWFAALLSEVGHSSDDRR